MVVFGWLVLLCIGLFWVAGMVGLIVLEGAFTGFSRRSWWILANPAIWIGIVIWYFVITKFPFTVVVT